MFQIDGLSGTGKSRLCAELTRRGHHAIDADAAFGLYADPITGLPSSVECRANWMWDGQKLTTFARSYRDAAIFICGGAMNQSEFVDLFAKRFILHVDSDTMRERLLTRTNNDYGKNAEELAEQLDLNMHAVEDAQRTGSIVIDAMRPINEVADDVVRIALS
jgi:dephospho-CoA kinase